MRGNSDRFYRQISSQKTRDISGKVADQRLCQGIRPRHAGSSVSAWGRAVIHTKRTDSNIGGNDFDGRLCTVRLWRCEALDLAGLNSKSVAGTTPIQPNSERFFQTGVRATAVSSSRQRSEIMTRLSPPPGLHFASNADRNDERNIDRHCDDRAKLDC